MSTINLNEYIYILPDDRIAVYPLEKRDQSNLLFYDKGKIHHHLFVNLPDLLPKNSHLFFNDTKVIPARLLFRKETGAEIEIFLLDPIAPSPVMSQAMQSHSPASWHCTIGNLRRWTRGITLMKQVDDTILTATLLNREKGIVEFSWDGNLSFAELIAVSGSTPLPPYLHRAPEPSDRERYQTVYSTFEGAVAAPTAGLHFTEDVLEKLSQKGIGTDFLTLHVSAGTFQPIKVGDARHHIMHNEQILISRQNVEHLLDEKAFTIAVGTTSMRTLESLYWYGTRLLQGKGEDFTIGQGDPYGNDKSLPSKQEALHAVASYMNRNKLPSLPGSTSIYILPGYTFRICQGLITNFHQPGSTLILLIAAFAGPDWRRIYDEALKSNYRFLSYGDSSLIIPGTS